MNETTKSEKSKLIEAVQHRGKFWDAMAIDKAVAAARQPDNETLRQDASRIVNNADNEKKMANDIIDMIHQYWPKESKQ